MRQRSYSLCRAFTLIELLVSVVVMTLLIVLVIQLTNSAMTIASASGDRLDCDGQARLIFDRMAGDFAKMVKRQDVDCVFAKLDGSGQNDAMFFFSEAPAYFSSTVPTGKSSVSLVGYRINSNNPYFPNRPVLERLGKGLAWSGTANAAAPGEMCFLSASGGSATPSAAGTIARNWPAVGTLAGDNLSAYANGTDANYAVLSDQVYRIELGFLLKDGSISDKPVLSSTPANWPASAIFYTQTGADPTLTSDNASGYDSGSRWYNTVTKQGYICTNATPGEAHWSRIGVCDVSAVIVAIAILASDSHKVIPSASAYTGMINALGDSVPGSSILQIWNGWNGSSYPDRAPYLTNSGVPKAVASQIRVYQRYFDLNGN